VVRCFRRGDFECASLLLTTLDHFHPHPSPAFLPVKWEKRKRIQATLSEVANHSILLAAPCLLRYVVFSGWVPGLARFEKALYTPFLRHYEGKENDPGGGFPVEKSVQMGRGLRKTS
jgi:hypothetical protein